MEQKKLKMTLKAYYLPAGKNAESYLIIKDRNYFIFWLDWGNDALIDWFINFDNRTLIPKRIEEPNELDLEEIKQHLKEILSTGEDIIIETLLTSSDTRIRNFVQNLILDREISFETSRFIKIWEKEEH